MINKKELTNPKIFGVLIVVAVASVLVITAISSQNAIVTICPPMCDEDIDVEEAE